MILFGIDLETTGLDPRSDQIIEKTPLGNADFGFEVKFEKIHPEG